MVVIGVADNSAMPQSPALNDRRRSVFSIYAGVSVSYSTCKLSFLTSKNASAECRHEMRLFRVHLPSVSGVDNE